MSGPTLSRLASLPIHPIHRIESTPAACRRREMHWVADGSRSTHAQRNAMSRLCPNVDGRRHDDGLVIWRGMLKPRAQAYAVNILWWPEKIDRPYVMITDPRSEEHTSELQSLMRSSYAVFCLKKKNRNKRQQQPTK